MRAAPTGLASRISLGPNTDILPGWKLTLDVSADGYWFLIKDTTDPCGFGCTSNPFGADIHSGTNPLGGDPGGRAACAGGWSA